MSTDGISKRFTICDEDGEVIVTLRMHVEFSDLLEDGCVEKIADFFDLTGKSFSLMME